MRSDFSSNNILRKNQNVEVGNRTTVSVIDKVPVYKNVYSRNFGALGARGLIYAPGLSMGSEPLLASTDERSRRPRAPG